ncbi:hypothetical protein [Myxosarcina sp. GI1(2024)]
MLNNELNSLQEELNYHRQSIEELEQKIAEAKGYEAFATQASDAVEEAIKQIGMGKYLWLFREHLMSLFPQEQPKYLEEVSVPLSQKSEAPLSSEMEAEKEDNEIEYMDDNDPNYKSIEELQKEEPDTVVAVYHSEEYLEQQEVKDTQASRARLLGIPDFTPTTYTDISPDIVYSSTGRCYVGFSNYNRAKNYGNQLCELYELTSGFLVDKSQIMTNHKYELKFWCSEANARRLVGLNLKKELDDPVNAKVVESWKRVEPTKSQPTSPKPIPISELEVGDIVHREGKPQDRYEVRGVKEKDGILFAEFYCLHHKDFKGLVGQTFSFKEVYLVSRTSEIEKDWVA